MIDIEKFVEIFRLSQRSVDKLDRENYGEIIGVEEIEAIENLIQENKNYYNLFNEIMEIIKYASDTSSPTVCEIKKLINKERNVQ